MTLGIRRAGRQLLPVNAARQTSKPQIVKAPRGMMKPVPGHLTFYGFDHTVAMSAVRTPGILGVPWEASIL